MPEQRMISNTRGIGQLLNERRYFEVPPHQRDYAWPSDRGPAARGETIQEATT
jgi:hypothetical protein